MAIDTDRRGLVVTPNPDDERLTQSVIGRDHTGREVATRIVVERPLTLYLNSQEIVTLMTIGDYPEFLAVGYLYNQGMVRRDDTIVSVDYDDDLEVVVVRTERTTDYEATLKKKTLTSGCAQGTAFGDLMTRFRQVVLDQHTVLTTGVLVQLLKTINTLPSLYLAAGAIHGCVLCEGGSPLIYVEDVGRHNAVDKIAGYMMVNKIGGAGMAFYTTGRLTSEMVIKAVQMEIPILISRSGFTAWGVELARQANLTLIGRARGRRFLVLSGDERLHYDGQE